MDAQTVDLLDGVMARASRDEGLRLTGENVIQLVQTTSDRSPPAPVFTDNRGESLKADLSRLVSFRDRVGSKQIDQVLYVLLALLDDLKFRQQQVAYVQSMGQTLKSVSEVEGMAHLKSINYDV